MEKIKEMLVIVGMIVVIILSFKGLEAMDNQAKNKAIEKCGKDNVVVKYTNQGDRYYQCKVEK